jgi:acetyl-CoA C-acetyltransferase
MGSTVPKDPDVGRPVNRSYWQHYELTSQFQAAELMAQRWGVTRLDADTFGKLSQDRAAAAWEAGRFDSQVIPINAPDLAEDGRPTESTHTVDRDEGLRPTSTDGLASLRPNLPDGVYTAGTSSQIADGAAAVLLMTREEAIRRGIEPLATFVDVCLVGCDPVLMLEGPIPATRKLLTDSGLTLADIDVVEINEAFASVVLAWEQELKPDMERVNPNGGAIALGHPLGATGAMLLTKAVHELQRIDGEHAITTMCCGGGLGTGTLLRRG